ncbi:MAG: leucine-rich repeat domain-containing protein [Bacteroidales bacterium]|nr:leucine-rich repeat domain-containing protein [Bacteroidales bacterium]
MRNNRLYTLLVLLMMASRLFAYDFDAICSTGQTLYYNINDDGVSVTVTYPCYGGQNNYYSGYEMPQGDLTISDSVEYQGVTYAVTKIGAHAFYGCYSLGAATLPNTLVEIGSHAFHGTNTNGYGHHLVIPDSVITVGSEAFSVVSVHELTIGKSVQNIGYHAFDCSNLKIIHYNATHCNDVASPPFGSSRNRNINTLTIGENVVYIPAKLFYCFDDLACDVVIPNSVTRIGEQAFFDANVTSVVIGDGCVEIGEWAFFNTHYLTSLKLGTGLKTIGESAFFSSGIEGDLVLPDSLEVVGYAAFYGNNLTSVHIGPCVSFMDSQAFMCYDLQSVFIKAMVPPIIGGHTFGDYSTPIYVPCASLCDYFAIQSTNEYWANYTNITAVFPYQITVESADEQMGYAYVTQLPDCCDIKAWAKAYPRPGFEFDCWKSDGVIVSTEEILGIDVVEDMHLVAYFKVYDGVGEDNSTIGVYPNPAKEKITIDGIRPDEVQVYNAYGQLVKTVHDTNEIPVADLPQGVYMLRITDAEGIVYTNKITKR